MILVDRALEARQSEGKPIRVGMIGAGAMARGVALQLLSVVPGMELVAIANRSPASARRAFTEAGDDDVVFAESALDVNRAMERRRRFIADDPYLVSGADGIDVLVEVTGTVEYGAGIVLDAIEHGKHVVLMNAELDATVGCILKKKADQNGVVYTNSDGDQPGVIMNLYRFVKGIGVRPVLCGNIKGLQDRYRNPTTQAAFAKRWDQGVRMVTSFADGSKISFEQAVVANATGMRVACRGMIGPEVPPGASIEDAVHWYDADALTSGPGIVDYVVGASPGPGIFVLGTNDHPVHKHYLNLYKLGEGPLYCFYNPRHLCYFEVHNTIARAAIFADATVAPLGAPTVEVVASAKVDLGAGERLDGIGGYHLYGMCENADVVQRERLLPLGLAEDCILRRPIRRDEVLSYADVELPPGRLSDRLRAEQDQYFIVDELAA